MNRMLTIAALSAAAGSAHAQLITWNALNGGWSDPLNWSPQNVPDTLGESAELPDRGSAYTVSCSATLSVDAITLSSLDASLYLVGGASFGVGGGGIYNAGLVLVNSNSSTFDTSLTFLDSGGLEGPGLLRLGRAGPDSQLNTTAPAIITNGVAHTIDGIGQINADLVNYGVIDANVAGQLLQLRDQNKSNNATIRATGGGILAVEGCTITQGPSGVLLADNGYVDFSIGTESTIIGGTLDTANGGLVRRWQATDPADITALDAVRNAGDLSIYSGGLVDVANGLTNDGAILVNSNFGTTDASVTFTNSGTLGGTGVLTLNRGGPDARLDSAPAAVITHAAGHTIRGAGEINAALVNNGLVEGDRNGQVLDLRQNDKSNNATVRATNGGIVEIEGITITQGTAGTLPAGTASTVIGGTLDTANGGLFRRWTAVTPGDVTALDAVTNEGDFRVAAGGYVEVADGITNNGSILVNSNSGTPDTYVTFTNSGTLGGTGVLTLYRFGDDSQLNTAPGAVITNAATHMIEGMGRINAALINEGLVDANIPGVALELRGQDKTNDAVMRATNGGILEIEDGITIDQTGGGEIVADASVVRFFSAESCAITGGTLRTPNLGYFERWNAGTTTLTGVVNEGDFRVLNDGRLDIVDGITNNGSILVNSNFGTPDTFVTFMNSGSLAGSGTLTLNRYGDDAQLNTAPGAVLTNAATHTIEGTGRINAALVNEGLIDANTPGVALELRGQDKTNNAVMRATNTGILEIEDGVTIDQSGGGEIVADSGYVDFPTGEACTIIGGSLESTASASIRRWGAILPDDTTTLDGVTSSGDFLVFAGGLINIGAGGLTNNGSIIVNSTNGTPDTFVSAVADATIGGTGEVLLYRAGLDSQIGAAPGFTLTNGASHTIRGVGELFGDVVNLGTVSPGTTVGTMTGSGDYTQGPMGSLAIELGGPVVGQYDRLNITGDATLAGTVDVTLVGGYVPANGHFLTIMTAGSINGEFGALNGPTLTPLVMRLVYRPTSVEIRVVCRPDLTTQNAPVGDPDYGVPDGVVSAADIQYYVNAWVAGDTDIADLTTLNAPIGDPYYGVPDGLVTAADIQFYVNLWIAGCP